MDKHYIYSCQEDSGNWDSEPWEVISIFVDTEEFASPGEYEITLYQGAQKDGCVSKYIPNITEHIQDMACEECWEYPFPTTEAQDKELQKLVESVIIDYFNKHRITAGFYHVEDIKELRCKVIISDGGLEDYEIYD